MVRELTLLVVPSPVSSVILICADSGVFALSEVCSKQGSPDLPKFTAPWNYKVISSAFFRFAADTIAKTHGVAASITQHLLFNVSNAFGEKCFLHIRI